MLSCSIHVQYTRIESDRLGYSTVRLTGSPIAKDLEKYTEVFTEGLKCWRIDSIGHGRTRPDSLCVGSTERESNRERLRKIHCGVYRGCKMLADRLRWTRKYTTSLSFVSVRQSRSPISRDLEKYTEVFIEGVELHRIRTDTTRLSLCRFD